MSTDLPPLDGLAKKCGHDGPHLPLRLEREVTTEERVALLEHQVELLRQTVGLLTVSGGPAVDRMDRKWEK